PLVLPPLRERSEDFSALIAHFARQVAAQNGWKEKPFAEEAIAVLRNYSWPGNVRELRNIVERLVLLSPEDSVSAPDVRTVLTGASSSESLTSSPSLTSGSLAERTEAFEKDVLLAEIRHHNFHMTNVAKSLGLERSHLYKKCQQLGIDLHSLRKPDWLRRRVCSRARLLPALSLEGRPSAKIYSTQTLSRSRRDRFASCLCVYRPRKSLQIYALEPPPIPLDKITDCN